MRKANGIVDNQPTPVDNGFIRFEFFDDGLPDPEDPRQTNLEFYFPLLEKVGKELVTGIIKKYGEEETVKFPTEAEPELDVQLPSMPLLKHDEIPSFLHPFDRYAILGRAILGQFKKLSKSSYVLMDTIQELDPEIVEEMSKVCIVKPVGPLFKIPEATNTTIRGDLMKADDCLDWLSSKPPASVIYISFGRTVYLKQEQVDEIAHGLLSYGVSFLWVMRPPRKAGGVDMHVLPEGFIEGKNHL
ncbi:hypothetical protein ACLB2K_016982 [Fragaria x ananassa]